MKDTAFRRLCAHVPHPPTLRMCLTAEEKRASQIALSCGCLKKKKKASRDTTFLKKTVLLEVRGDEVVKG